MAAGEVMINDAFFDGEAKTVSLSGASLAALPGGAPREAAAEVAVEDVDDSASDASSLSDSSDEDSDEDDDAPENDNDNAPPPPVDPGPTSEDDLASVYSGPHGSVESSASSAAGSATPARRPSSKQSARASTDRVVERSPANELVSARTLRRDFSATPASRSSGSDSESPYKGDFAPKASRRASARAAPVSEPPPSRPSKSSKSPYSGTFKGSSDSNSTSSDSDSAERVAPAKPKRGSSKRLRSQRAKSLPTGSDSTLRHMMGHLLLANIIVVLAALLWMDRGALLPFALAHSCVPPASAAFACAGLDALWSSPLLSLFVLATTTVASLLWGCLKRAPPPAIPRWRLRQMLHSQAKHGASSYLRKLRRTRKPPDKAGRRRVPKRSAPRGPTVAPPPVVLDGVPVDTMDSGGTTVISLVARAPRSRPAAPRLASHRWRASLIPPLASPPVPPGGCSQFSAVHSSPKRRRVYVASSLLLDTPHRSGLDCSCWLRVLPHASCGAWL